MTILGAHVQDADHATLWVDTLCFRMDGRPAGHLCKLAVNARARLLGAGGGWGTIAAAGDGVVRRATDLDDAVSHLPGALRQAALRGVQHAETDPHSFAACCYLVAGWSRSGGCLWAYRFEATSLFAAEVVRYALAPWPDDAGRPGDDFDVLALARRQMAALQNFNPNAGTGDLTVGTIGPDSITIRTIPKFSSIGDPIWP